MRNVHPKAVSRGTIDKSIPTGGQPHLATRPNRSGTDRKRTVNDMLADCLTSEAVSLGRIGP
jgi:hypothetical protein